MKILALACLAAALVLSCSPADVVSPAIQEACRGYAYAYCTQLETCSPAAVQIRYQSTEVCESLLNATCQGAATAPSSGFTVADREACTSVIPSWPCPDFLYVQNPPPQCQATTGALADGASCADSQQCQSGYCGLPAGSACGTCGPVPQPGDSCASTQCPSGLACVGAPPICAAYVEVGGACQTSAPCNAQLTCVAGKCVAALKTLGEACTYSGPGCDEYSGLSCNGVSTTCQTATIAQPGQACGTVGGQEAYCVTGGCVRGVCVGDVPVGGACEVGGTPCVDDARCIVPAGEGTSGTCQINGTSVCP